MPGAESIHADAGSTDSYEGASRKLKNLVGAEVSKMTLQSHSMRIGQETREFKREDAEVQSAGQKTWNAPDARRNCNPR